MKIVVTNTTTQDVEHLISIYTTFDLCYVIYIYTLYSLYIPLLIYIVVGVNPLSSTVKCKLLYLYITSFIVPNRVPLPWLGCSKNNLFCVIGTTIYFKGKKENNISTNNGSRETNYHIRIALYLIKVRVPGLLVYKYRSLCVQCELEEIYP